MFFWFFWPTNTRITLTYPCHNSSNLGAEPGELLGCRPSLFTRVELQISLEAQGVLTFGHRRFLHREFHQNALTFTFGPDIVISNFVDQTPFALSNKYSVVCWTWPQSAYAMLGFPAKAMWQQEVHRNVELGLNGSQNPLELILTKMLDMLGLWKLGRVLLQLISPYMPCLYESLA